MQNGVVMNDNRNGLSSNRDVVSYLVTKHSWKGRYKRVFSIGTDGLATYNPCSLERTNFWSYGDVASVKPAARGTSVSNEFLLVIRGKGKTGTLRFSSDYTADIMTELMKCKLLRSDLVNPENKWKCQKYHWSGATVPVVLVAASYGLLQFDVANRLVCEYFYKDIEELIKVSDVAGGFIVMHGCGHRLHMFSCSDRDGLLTRVATRSADNVGVVCKESAHLVSPTYFRKNRLGVYGGEEHLTSLVEFTVSKVSTRHQESVARLLCITETCTVERDIASYNVVSLSSLGDVFSLVRSEDDPHLFIIEYLSGKRKSYKSVERDNVLTALLDGVRGSGKFGVHVKMLPTNRALRWIPLNFCLDEESEVQHLKFIINSTSHECLLDALRRFNANIPYSGLLHSVSQEGLFAANKEKLIVNCALTVVDIDPSLSPVDWENVYHTLRRLFASKAGFHAFTNVPRLREKLGILVVGALKLSNEAVHHAAIETLCALMQPIHNAFELKQEQLNKSSLLSSKKFLENLTDVLVKHVEQNTGTLMVTSLLDFLTYALCIPYSETTLSEQFDVLLELVASSGRTLYKLFQSPAVTVVKSAGLVMRAIIEEAEPSVASRLQEYALSEGAFLRHLHTALFTVSTDMRLMTICQLSRHLISLWATGSCKAMELLQRILPEGLLLYLESDDEVPLIEENLLLMRSNFPFTEKEEGKESTEAKDNQILDQLMQIQKAVEKQLESLLQHWRLRQKAELQRKSIEKDRVTPTLVLRKRRERVKVLENWRMLFYMFNKNHNKSNLIWNAQTREDLKTALENEIQAFERSLELEAGVKVSWNYANFEVHYGSLKNEVCVGNHFLRIFIEEQSHSHAPKLLTNPRQFFYEVYHRYLSSVDMEIRCLCLKTLSVTYSRYCDEVGAFTDTKYIVSMLEQCTDLAERDSLLDLICKLALEKANVKQIIDSNGIELLVDLATLAHLDKRRRHLLLEVNLSTLIPQTRSWEVFKTNVIECSNDTDHSDAAEWYYLKEKSDKVGPVSFIQLCELYRNNEVSSSTLLTAQGLSGWKELENITQFRWHLVASGQSALSETDVAILVLDLLIEIMHFYPSRDEGNCIIRPASKVRQILTSQSCLPYIVQLFLTFDPNVVAKTATLLNLLIEDSVVLPRLYLTGLFFFALMYNGSNILQISHLFKSSHMKQAFLSTQVSEKPPSRSILYPLLPDAAIYYLENYGAEKYAEIFLGEFDNPEIIWCAEMRRYLIERIAAHVADFSSRLPSNVRATYQYCPIAPVIYSQLKNELFCHMFYLRHLCDTFRFPEWTISDPVALLRSCLAAWQAEVNTEEPLMSIEEACKVLNVTYKEICNNPSLCRKAYYRLAHKYHPDKNPSGREQFERLNYAYEMLCTEERLQSSAESSIERIVLCMKTQCLIYTRYANEIRQYKYPGYTLLIKTIDMESTDQSLFAKDGTLLMVSTELCFLTVACSVINVEQLRREGGLKVLHAAFSRCAAIVGESTNPDDTSAVVCLNVCHTFVAAAGFPEAEAVIVSMETLPSELLHLLRFTKLLRLNCAVAECVSALSVSEFLRSKLFSTGILYHLIVNIFSYDLTLDEGGVVCLEATNIQAMQNKLARLSCEAIAGIAGFKPGCTASEEIVFSIRALLTPYICDLLETNSYSEVLKALSSSCETPRFIWNNSMKTELLEWLSSSLIAVQRQEKPDDAGFHFSCLAEEFCVGDVFVRIYNQQPTYLLKDSKRFCLELLNYLSHPEGDMERLRLASEALVHILNNNPALEIQCIGYFESMLKLLQPVYGVEIYGTALNILRLAVANENCLNDLISVRKWYKNFVLIVKAAPESVSLVLETCLLLASSSQVCSAWLESGFGVFLLRLFCCHEDMDVRRTAGELLAKLQADRLFGPRWSRFVSRFIPPAIGGMMKESASSAVHLLDSQAENPELVWDSRIRSLVCQSVEEAEHAFVDWLQGDEATEWALPQDFQVAYEHCSPGDMIIGGVSLRLFIANPVWNLRNPKKFLVDLMSALLLSYKSTLLDETRLETLSRALVLLLHCHKNLCDAIAAHGYIPLIVDALSSPYPAVMKSSLYILYQMADNQLCVSKIGDTDCVARFSSVLKEVPEMLHVACRALSTLFDHGDENLVAQAIQCRLHYSLLEILASELSSSDSPAAIKAEIVKALNCMAACERYHDEMEQLLNNSPTWTEFKGQKHDLFITCPSQMKFLANVHATAGYITQEAHVNYS